MLAMDKQSRAVNDALSGGRGGVLMICKDWARTESAVWLAAGGELCSAAGRELVLLCLYG